MSSIVLYIKTHACIFGCAPSNQIDFKHLPKDSFYLSELPWFSCEMNFFSKERRILSFLAYASLFPFEGLGY